MPDAPPPDLSVELAGIRFRTPLIAASGTFGYGTEYLEVADYEAIGGIAVKGLYLEPREGSPPPRIWETPSGMLNAIGLQEVGIERFLREKMPRLRELPCAILVNICGSSLEEYAELAGILDSVEGVSGIEMNISCPNVDQGGILFGCDPKMAARVTEAVRERTRLPVIPKLSPNVTDIGIVAREVEAAGASAISLINTIPAMAIDVETRKPRLANVVGGLSGPAIRPIAVRLVYQARQAVRIPIIGIGGIASHEDALEFILAGASAVQIGTMTFVDPSIFRKVLDGLEDYCRRHRVPSLASLTGALVADVKAVPPGW
jgi:dihydroorotate dehydrogenase (NAD+) catalytic subunit